MADLVAHMAEQRPVGLAHLQAALLAPRVVGLGEVEGDEAVRVTRGHGLRLAREQVEREPARVGSPSSRSSNSSHRFAASAAARRSRPRTSPSAGRVRVSSQLAHSSPSFSTSQLQRRGRVGAAKERARLAIEAVELGILADVDQRDHLVLAGLEAELRLAVEAGRVLEEDELSAVLAGEGAHRDGRA